MITSPALAMLLAATLQTNRLFQDVAIDLPRPWTIEVGFDRRRTDWSKIAPFAVFSPLATRPGTRGRGYVADFQERDHVIGLSLGIVDTCQILCDGVPTLSGLCMLDRVWPLVFAAMQDALPGLAERCSLGEPELEYVQDSFPLIFINAVLTVTQTLAVGSRRS